MYNQQFKFIFVEIDKNATTLMTEILKHVSHFWQPNEHLCRKYNILNEHGEVDQDTIKKMCKESWHYKHASLSFWKDQLGYSEYNDCFKFTLVRNSWDRVLSLYLRNQGSLFYNKMNFRQFVDWIINASDTCNGFGELIIDKDDRLMFDIKSDGFGPSFDGEDHEGHHRGKRRHQLSYLTVDNQIDINEWISVSEAGWTSKIPPLLRKLGIDDPVLQSIKNYIDDTLGIKRCHLKKDGAECPGDSYDVGGAHECLQLNRSPHRNHKLHYSIYYDDEMRDIIAEKFKLDNDYFNFSFEDKRDQVDNLNKLRTENKLNYF